MSIGNKIGLGLRQAANYVAYGIVTIRDAGQIAGQVISKQFADVKLGLVDGVDTTKPAQKKKVR